jgi:hypothetical protein
MKVIVHILTNLAICMDVPIIYNFVFVYSHSYSKFDFYKK